MTRSALSRLALVAMLAAPALSSCEVPPAGLVPTSPTSPRGSVAADALIWANRVRRDMGAPALRPDPRLDQVAAEYALELARRGTIDHVSPVPGRETADLRMRAGGAAYARWGENLGWTSADAERAAMRVVHGWLESPTHRINLLNGHFRRVGTGAVIGPDGAWYVVQLYAAGRPRRAAAVPLPQ